MASQPIRFLPLGPGSAPAALECCPLVATRACPGCTRRSADLGLARVGVGAKRPVLCPSAAWRCEGQFITARGPALAHANARATGASGRLQRSRWRGPQPRSRRGGGTRSTRGAVQPPGPTWPPAARGSTHCGTGGGPLIASRSITSPDPRAGRRSRPVDETAFIPPSPVAYFLAVLRHAAQSPGWPS